jgi:hypothetical protein
VEEVEQRIKLDSEFIIDKLRRAEDDYILAKQVRKNLDSKRKLIAKDYFECDKLNLTRKLAVKSLKDRIDD